MFVNKREKVCVSKRERVGSVVENGYESAREGE